MTPAIIVSVIVVYFLALVLISYLTSRNADNETFFLGERKSPWYLVSFGMIGASLSGVTFLSVPGWVGDAGNQMSYMQVVFGYLIGYLVVAYVLMPIYYRLNVVSIYEYLKSRFGFWSYKTGASFFLLSRIIGCSVRLLLVADVLQSILFDKWGVPFPVTVMVSVGLIWLYTNRGGIKTIVWTDTFQTAFMIVSVILTVWFVTEKLELEQGIVRTISESSYSKIFFFEDFMSKNHFLKHFFGGMFITIGMTGLDQDMMQKNLSCKNIGEAQKNMVSMSLVLILVNFLFLGLGALLYMYATKFNIDFGRGDLLFSTIAMDPETGVVIGVLFLLGLIAAAYSSADSALTSLTTSFSVDFLNINESKSKITEVSELNSEQTNGTYATRVRKKVHIGMSIAVVLVVMILKYATYGSAIDMVMQFAGFTYGPLIGIFFFGILTKRSLNDKMAPIICVVSILITFLLWYFSTGSPGVPKGELGLFGRYVFGYELIIVNALITFIGLGFISTRKLEFQVK